MGKDKGRSTYKASLVFHLICFAGETFSNENKSFDNSKTSFAKRLSENEENQKEAEEGTLHNICRN